MCVCARVHVRACVVVVTVILYFGTIIVYKYQRERERNNIHNYTSE